MIKLDRVVIEGAIYVAGCAFALWKGGRPERLVAGVMLLEFFIDSAWRYVQPLEDPHYVTLALDFCVLAAVMYAVFTTNLRWPLLAAALQILSVLSHITRIIDPSIRSWAYVTVGIAIGYGLMAAVMFGAVMQMRDPTRGGRLGRSTSA